MEKDIDLNKIMLTFASGRTISLADCLKELTNQVNIMRTALKIYGVSDETFDEAERVVHQLETEIRRDQFRLVTKENNNRKD